MSSFHQSDVIINNQLAEKRCLENKDLLDTCPYRLLKEHQKGEKDIALAAVVQDGSNLKYSPPEIQNDKEVVMVACSGCGMALQFASKELQNDKEVVMNACSVDGNALHFASEDLRCNKEVVMTALEKTPQSLRYAMGGLNQDLDCLIKAGLWDYGDFEDPTIEHNSTQNQCNRKTKIVLSTKFSLAADSSPHATKFVVALNQHPYISESKFLVYSPNAFSKGTCDPNWTDKNWPCLGTHDSCKMPLQLKTGVPQETECCWRYSFRYHLKEGLQTGGFMIQVVDRAPEKTPWSSTEDGQHMLEIMRLNYSSAGVMV